MLKTSSELKEQAKKIGLTRWNIHDCSMCGYWCGYNIKDDDVTYDSGCNCSWGGEQESSWDDLTESFNMNQPEKNPRMSEEALKKHYGCWKFENETSQS